MCNEKKQTNERKLNDLLQVEIFNERKNPTGSVARKIEKDITRELFVMKKTTRYKVEINGAQPARLHSLEKMPKQGTPLRPVLFLPGSSNDYQNKTFEKGSDEFEGTNLVTITQMPCEILEKTQLDSDESLISLDVKILYTNMPPNKLLK